MSVLAIRRYLPLRGGTVSGALTVNGLLTTNGQIAFPATQNASANANTLDDYEEGTWTPTFDSTGTAPTGVTYTTQSATYTKIGRLVFLRGRMTLSSKGAGGTGQARMLGLPFTPSAIVSWGGFRSSGYTLPSTGKELDGLVNTNSTITFVTGSNTGEVDVAWGDVTNAFDVIFGMVHEV